MTRMPRRRFAGALLAALTAATLAACGAAGYPETPLTPTPTATATSTGPTAPPVSPPPSKCTPGMQFDPLQSYDPLPSLPADPAALGGRLQQIRQRGYLVVGVSADTLLMGARNPLTGQIEGFDIDIAREVARAIFGSPDKINLVVITAPERQTKLVDGTLDMVARNMTMNCQRWLDWPIAFSSEYYRSGQKVLVRKGMAAKSLDDLAQAKSRVCAPNATTSMTKLREYESKGIVPVGAGTHTGCLVLFQQGSVDGITGDDTVLAGLAAQDPYAVVPTGQQAVTAEPYGLGFPAGERQLVRYANRVLETIKADGRWKSIYDRWLAEPLGPAPGPPVGVYGRQ